MAQDDTSDNPSAFTGQKEQNAQMQKRNLTTEAVKAIEFVLSNGDRAEVIPIKDGVRVMRVRREAAYGNAMEKANPRKQTE